MAVAAAEGSTGGTDDEVAAALGVGTPDTDQGGEEVGQDSNESEGVFDDLPEWAQTRIREAERETAALRRENAQRRISARTSARNGSSDGEAGSDEPNARALSAAEKRGRDAARLEFGMQLAQAKIEGALAGTLSEEQIADIVEDINLSRFVDDAGEVDSEAVRVLKDKYTNILGAKKVPPPKIGHGQQGNGRQAQRSTADQFADALGASLGG